jgi:hypothetical protein
MADEAAGRVAAADQAAAGAPAGDGVCSDCPLHENHFVKLRLVDEDGNALADQVFVVKTPDGKDVVGLTDAQGFGEVPGIPAGQCSIRFPLLDRDAWEKK